MQRESPRKSILGRQIGRYLWRGTHVCALRWGESCLRGYLEAVSWHCPREHRAMGFDLNTIGTAALGGVATLVGQAFLKRWEQSRTDERSMRDEQKKLAKDVLRHIERFCTEAERRRWSGRSPASSLDDPLSHLREEIAAEAVAFTNPIVRKRMDNLDTAMWFVLTPDGQPPSAYPIRTGARELLGAIMRGEALPAEMMALSELVEKADAYNDYINYMSEVQEAGEKQRDEYDREPRLAKAAASQKPDAPSPVS